MPLVRMDNVQQMLTTLSNDAEKYPDTIDELYIDIAEDRNEYYMIAAASYLVLEKGYTHGEAIFMAAFYNIDEDPHTVMSAINMLGSGKSKMFSPIRLEWAEELLENVYEINLSSVPIRPNDYNPLYGNNMHEISIISIIVNDLPIWQLPKSLQNEIKNNVALVWTRKS